MVQSQVDKVSNYKPIIMRYITTPIATIILSIINLLLYLLVINNFIKFARQTIFYITGIYITFAIVILTILYMIVKKQYGLRYWFILLINTVVFIWAYSYLQNVLRVK